MELWNRYSEVEDQLIQEFWNHPVYRKLTGCTYEWFVSYLLQVGYIARNFVLWYETAKLGLSEAGKEVVREILRDEIPSSGMTHQDARVKDLLALGVPLETVLNTKPTPQTQLTITKLFDLIKYPQDDYDLRVLITLRVAGEVLVSVQYEPIVMLLEKFGLAQEKQHFFYPHYLHDKKGGQEGWHTEGFDSLLQQMIVDERTLAVAEDAARKAFEARSSIHDQFA